MGTNERLSWTNHCSVLDCGSGFVSESLISSCRPAQRHVIRLDSHEMDCRAAERKGECQSCRQLGQPERVAARSFWSLYLSRADELASIEIFAYVSSLETRMFDSPGGNAAGSFARWADLPMAWSKMIGAPRPYLLQWLVASLR